jgi:hypothetical protein
MSNWYKKLTIENSYRDFQMNRPHVDLSPNLSPMRREALNVPPSVKKKASSSAISPTRGEREGWEGAGG